MNSITITSGVYCPSYTLGPEDFPAEILLGIMGHLDSTFAFYNLARSSKFWRDLVYKCTRNGDHPSDDNPCASYVPKSRQIWFLLAVFDGNTTAVANHLDTYPEDLTQVIDRSTRKLFYKWIAAGHPSAYIDREHGGSNDDFDDILYELLSVCWPDKVCVRDPLDAVYSLNQDMIILLVGRGAHVGSQFITRVVSAGKSELFIALHQLQTIKPKYFIREMQGNVETNGFEFVDSVQKPCPDLFKRMDWGSFAYRMQSSARHDVVYGMINRGITTHDVIGYFRPWGH